MPQLNNTNYTSHSIRDTQASVFENLAGAVHEHLIHPSTPSFVSHPASIFTRAKQQRLGWLILDDLAAAAAQHTSNVNNNNKRHHHEQPTSSSQQSHQNFSSPSSRRGVKAPKVDDGNLPDDEDEDDDNDNENDEEGEGEDNEEDEEERLNRQTKLNDSAFSRMYDFLNCSEIEQDDDEDVNGGEQKKSKKQARHAEPFLYTFSGKKWQDHIGRNPLHFIDSSTVSLRVFDTHGYARPTLRELHSDFPREKIVNLEVELYFVNYRHNNNNNKNSNSSAANSAIASRKSTQHADVSENNNISSEQENNNNSTFMHRQLFVEVYSLFSDKHPSHPKGYLCRVIPAFCDLLSALDAYTFQKLSKKIPSNVLEQSETSENPLNNKNKDKNDDDDDDPQNNTTSSSAVPSRVGSFSFSPSSSHLIRHNRNHQSQQQSSFLIVTATNNNNNNLSSFPSEPSTNNTNHSAHFNLLSDENESSFDLFFHTQNLRYMMYRDGQVHSIPGRLLTNKMFPLSECGRLHSFLEKEKKLRAYPKTVDQVIIDREMPGEPANAHYGLRNKSDGNSPHGPRRATDKGCWAYLCPLDPITLKPLLDGEDYLSDVDEEDVEENTEEEESLFLQEDEEVMIVKNNNKSTRKDNKKKDRHKTEETTSQSQKLLLPHKNNNTNTRNRSKNATRLNPFIPLVGDIITIGRGDSCKLRIVTSDEDRNTGIARTNSQVDQNGIHCTIEMKEYYPTLRTVSTSCTSTVNGSAVVLNERFSGDSKFFNSSSSTTTQTNETKFNVMHIAKLHCGDIIELGNSKEFEKKFEKQGRNQDYVMERVGADEVIDVDDDDDAATKSNNKKNNKKRHHSSSSSNQLQKVYTPAGARRRRLYGPPMFKIIICGRGVALRAKSPRVDKLDFIPVPKKLDREDDDEVGLITDEDTKFHFAVKQPSDRWFDYIREQKQKQERQLLVNNNNGAMTSSQLQQQQSRLLSNNNSNKFEQNPFVTKVHQGEFNTSDRAAVVYQYPSYDTALPTLENVNDRLYNHIRTREESLRYQDAAATNSVAELWEQYQKLCTKGTSLYVNAVNTLLSTRVLSSNSLSSSSANSSTKNSRPISPRDNNNNNIHNPTLSSSSSSSSTAVFTRTKLINALFSLCSSGMSRYEEDYTSRALKGAVSTLVFSSAQMLIHRFFATFDAKSQLDFEHISNRLVISDICLLEGTSLGLTVADFSSFLKSSSSSSPAGSPTSASSPTEIDPTTTSKLLSSTFPNQNVENPLLIMKKILDHCLNTTDHKFLRYFYTFGRMLYAAFSTAFKQHCDPLDNSFNKTFISWLYDSSCNKSIRYFSPISLHIGRKFYNKSSRRHSSMIHSMQTHDGDEVRAAMFLSCHPTALQQRDCDEYYQKKWAQERRKQYRQENDDDDDDEDNDEQENEDEDEEGAPPQRTFVDAKPGYIRSSFLDNWETEADFMKEGGYFFHGPTADERRNWRDFRGKDVQMSDFERDFFLPGLDWQVEPFSVADAALILVRLCEASPDLSVEEERQNAIGIVAAASSQKDIDSSDDDSEENFDVQEERASTANGISRVATKNLLSPGATPPTTSAINNNSNSESQLHHQQSSNQQNEQQGKNKKTSKTKQIVDHKQKRKQKQEDSVSPLPPSSRASTAKMNNSPLQQLEDENNSNMGTMMMTMPPALTAISNNNKSTLFNSIITNSAMINNVDVPPPSNMTSSSLLSFHTSTTRPTTDSSSKAMMMNNNNNDDSNQSSSEHSNSTKELNSPPKTKNNNVHDNHHHYQHCTSTLPNYILFGPFVVYFSVYENIYDLAFSHFYRPLHDLGDDSPRFELEVARGKESVKKSSVLFVESRFEEEIVPPTVSMMNIDSSSDDAAMIINNTSNNNNSQSSQHVSSSSSHHYSSDQTVVLEAKRTFESTIAILEKEYQKTLVKRFGYFSPIQLASRLRQIRGPFLDPNTNAGIVLQPTSATKNEKTISEQLADLSIKTSIPPSPKRRDVNIIHISHLVEFSDDLSRLPFEIQAAAITSYVSILNYETCRMKYLQGLFVTPTHPKMIFSAADDENNLLREAQTYSTRRHDTEHDHLFSPKAFSSKKYSVLTHAQIIRRVCNASRIYSPDRIAIVEKAVVALSKLYQVAKNFGEHWTVGVLMMSKQSDENPKKYFELKKKDVDRIFSKKIAYTTKELEECEAENNTTTHVDSDAPLVRFYLKDQKNNQKQKQKQQENTNTIPPAARSVSGFEELHHYQNIKIQTDYNNKNNIQIDSNFDPAQSKINQDFMNEKGYENPLEMISRLRVFEVCAEITADRTSSSSVSSPHLCRDVGQFSHQHQQEVSFETFEFFENWYSCCAKENPMNAMFEAFNVVL